MERVARMSTGAPAKAPRSKLFVTEAPLSPQEDLRRMRASAAARSQQLLDLRLENEALEVQARRHRAMIAALRDEIDSLKKKAEKPIAENSDAAKKLDGEIKILQDKYTSYVKDTQMTYNMLEYFKKQLAAAEQERDKLRQSNARIEVYEAGMREMEKERDEYAAKQKEQEVFIQWMEQQIYSLRGEKGAAEAEVARMKAQKNKRRRR